MLNNRLLLQKKINKLVSLYERDLLKEASIEADSLVSQYPDVAIIYNIYGIINLALSRWNESVSCFSKAIKLNPAYAEGHYNLGIALDNLGHLEEAIINYAKAIEIKPDFVFHLAAQSLVSVSYTDPVETISTIVSGTANVLEALRQSNQHCVAIIITSDKCYDNVEWPWGYKETDALGGKDIYSGSKSAAELIFKSYFHSFFKPRMRFSTASNSIYILISFA